MHRRLVYGSNGKLHPVAWNLACILRIYRTCNSTVGLIVFYIELIHLAQKLKKKKDSIGHVA